MVSLLFFLSVFRQESLGASGGHTIPIYPDQYGLKRVRILYQRLEVNRHAGLQPLPVAKRIRLWVPSGRRLAVAFSFLHAVIERAP